MLSPYPELDENAAIREIDDVRVVAARAAALVQVTRTRKDLVILLMVDLEQKKLF